jgi:hypothetical protein
MLLDWPGGACVTRAEAVGGRLLCAIKPAVETALRNIAVTAAAIQIRALSVMPRSGVRSLVLERLTAQTWVGASAMGWAGSLPAHHASGVVHQRSRLSRDVSALLLSGVLSTCRTPLASRKRSARAVAAAE